MKHVRLKGNIPEFVFRANTGDANMDNRAVSVSNGDFKLSNPVPSSLWHHNSVSAVAKFCVIDCERDSRPTANYWEIHESVLVYTIYTVCPNHGENRNVKVISLSQ